MPPDGPVLFIIYCNCTLSYLAYHSANALELLRQTPSICHSCQAVHETPCPLRPVERVPERWRDGRLDDAVEPVLYDGFGVAQRAQSFGPSEATVSGRLSASERETLGEIEYAEIVDGHHAALEAGCDLTAVRERTAKDGRAETVAGRVGEQYGFIESLGERKHIGVSTRVCWLWLGNGTDRETHDE
jgi:hypothetical protein